MSSKRRIREWNGVRSDTTTISFDSLRITPAEQIIVPDLFPTGCYLCTWQYLDSIGAWRLKYRHSACLARVAGGHG